MYTFFLAPAPAVFNHCLSSNQKLDANTVLNTGSISQIASSSGSEAVFVPEQNDPTENQIESITVSRTPPWRKNSILNQQQQQQNIDNPNISNTNGRVPPLPQQHIMQTQTQPPWQEETQKRRCNSSKRRPNFKEDPTGYLNHQTAILHSSILNVHSPELQDNESSDSSSQNAYRHSPMNSNRNSTHSVDMQVNLLNENLLNEVESQDDQQKISVMQQQQQNQSVYIQQLDSNIISKNQMIIGSNGQAMRVVPNVAPIIYTNSNEFPMNMATSAAHSMQSIARLSEFTGVKRVQNIMKTQTVQIQGKHQQQTKSIPILSQQQIHSEQNANAGQYSKLLGNQQTTIMSQSDQETSRLNADDNENIGLPIDVTHLPNGVVQVHQSCDNNEAKNQTQTILVESNQPITNARNSQSKLNDHQYIIPHKQGIFARVSNISQESPVSSSTVNKSAIIEIKSNVNDRGPSQVGTISTSNESPPIVSPDTSALSESLVLNSETRAMNHSNKLRSNVYIAGQTSGKNTITSVLAGKAMTSTTTTNQFGSNEKNRPFDSGNVIQIHENRILRPAQMIKQANNNTVNRAVQPIVQENITSVSSQTNLSNIQLQQPPNQIIMTSSGCQILVMPTQNNKNSNPMIIGQPTNTSTLVVNNSSVLSPQNAQVIGNEMIQGINDTQQTFR